MSNTNSAIKRTHVRSREHVILFARPGDPALASSMKRIEAAGRQVVVRRPDFDSGVGICGNHLCHCKGECKAKFKG